MRRPPTEHQEALRAEVHDALQRYHLVMASHPWYRVTSSLHLSQAAEHALAASRLREMALSRRRQARR